MTVLNSTLYHYDEAGHPFGQIGVITDMVLGTLLILCTLLGTPANLAWVVYFIRNGRRDIATVLYEMVGLLSIVLLVNMLLVAVSLFSHREPCLFQVQVVCSAWSMIHSYCHFGILLLTMLLNVTSTIAITRPFLKIHKTWVMAFYGTVSVGSIAFGFAKIHTPYLYNPAGPFCHSRDRSTFYTLFLAGEAILPTLVTSIGFTISHRYLTTRDGPTESLSRHASITIKIFTLTFLSCNVPYFIFMFTLTSIFFLMEDEREMELTNSSLFLYLGLVCRILMPAVNTVINPAILYTRIRKFSEWVDKKKRRLTRVATDTMLLRRMGSLSKPDPVNTCVVVSELPFSEGDAITYRHHQTRDEVAQAAV